MLKIKKYDEIIEKQDKEELKKVNVAVFRAYNALKETKNSMLDFAETYYMEGIKEITEELKKFGIENFTVSEASTALMSELEEFEKFGFKVQGLTQVVSQMRDYQTFELKKVPAIVMKRC